jgi:hypothetical protein
MRRPGPVLRNYHSICLEGLKKRRVQRVIVAYFEVTVSVLVYRNLGEYGAIVIGTWQQFRALSAV